MNQRVRQLRRDPDLCDEGRMHVPTREKCRPRKRRHYKAGQNIPIDGLLRKYVSRPWSEFTSAFHARTGSKSRKALDMRESLDRVISLMDDYGEYWIGNNDGERESFFVDHGGILCSELEQNAPGTGRRTLTYEDDDGNALRAWVKKRRVFRGLCGRWWWARVETRTACNWDNSECEETWLIPIKPLTHEELVFYDSLSGQVRNRIEQSYDEHVEY